MFEPGQLVLCVDASTEGQLWPDETWSLTEGRVYTVKACLEHRGTRGRYKGSSVPCLALVEVRNTTSYQNGEGFAASRFRPLPDSRLALFRAALEPTKEIA